MPWSVAFGAEAVVVRRGAYTMSVVGSIDYGFWSAYQDRQGQSPSTYGPGLGFHDTMSGALGVRHAYKTSRAFVDFRYIPSPVPDADRPLELRRQRPLRGRRGRRHPAQAGSSLRPGIQLFADRFIPRLNEKNDALIPDELPDGSTFGATGQPVPGSQGLQTNNPGWPGFSSGGWLWGGAFTLAVPL